MDVVVWASGALILLGLAGIVIPLLPGLGLVLAGVLLWAIEQQSVLGWSVMGAAVVLALAGKVVEYLVPGRRMRAAGVPTATLLAGAALAVVGFFVVPVVGLVLGFVLGVYLTELARRGGHGPAWAATKHALHAVVLSAGIELATGALIAALWVASVVLG
ncbi:MAG TPA: DUF456 domain-containing protein [Segeticoccus sp.]|uniref:DUF456 domain-containing protein n=1 Tax=Segeticoccus sp. TaxID=2706531 RepID=UPI002D80435C|nr:DUF456 domain-containing protein [Segeticoccus sp.]HET8600276.1 DUF456 domain-containing protein [Segeticoccus sp.]